MPRTHLGKRERYDVLSRCNFACFYCGIPARLGVIQLQVEHVVPIVQGGTNDPWNLVAACQPCNAGKSDSSPTNDLVEAAIDLYTSWTGRPLPVRICTHCRRPWVQEVDDEEPMDQCWPCVFAQAEGIQIGKRIGGAS